MQSSDKWTKSTERLSSSASANNNSISNGDTLVHCSCGNKFYTDFPLESDPPQAQCPVCNKYHQDPTANDNESVDSFSRNHEQAYRDFCSEPNPDSKHDPYGTLVNCSCGHEFYTNFPLESDPPRARCNSCGQLHSDGRSPGKSVPILTDTRQAGTNNNMVHDGDVVAFINSLQTQLTDLNEKVDWLVSNARRTLNSRVNL